MGTRPAWWLLALTTVLLAVGELFTLLGHAFLPTDNEIANFAFAGPTLAFAIVGALIAARRPGHRIGWICLAIGLLLAIVVAGDALSSWGLHTGSLPPTVCNWLGWVTAAWVPMLGLMAIQLPLRLPDGHALWRRYAHTGTVATALVSVVLFCQPSDVPGLTNPTAAGWAQPLTPVLLALPLLAFGAIASVVVRYRRAASLERHQLRWIAFGAAVFVGVYVVAIGILIGAGIDDGSPFGIVLTTTVQVAYLAIPVAIGYAVLRHRLYDIDVVINRALVYAGLTATLGAAYFATVLVLQVALAPLTSDSGLAVAASTLAVAGLFRPARARIQATVDRRFFRRRYDAVRTLAAFNARLRDELDLDSLSGELRAIVEQTMQPAHVSLWLRRAVKRET